MTKVCCLNNISSKGTDLLGAEYVLTDELAEADAVLVRSASMHEAELPESLLAIARAGAGVNNIPLEKCADRGIVVFNAPGANANAVKELVLAGMLLASRDIIGGVEWGRANRENPDVSKAAEKEKKKFAGCEIAGKTLGIIGLGAIGYKLAKAAEALGMQVLGYDPYLDLQDVKMTKNLDDIFAVSDYITLHVPLLPDTREMIDAAAIAKMKDGVVILNYARDLLVQEADLAEALKSGKVKRYLCDFANPNTLAMENCIVTPHLGASTEESEENCAIMAVEEIRNYVENGNIINSVTFPRVDKGVPARAVRLGVFYKDTDALEGLKALLGDDVQGGMRGVYGYAVADLDETADLDAVKSIPGVYRVRVVRG
ncbi:MAG: 3-phosphoglycerate dehydrogenase family protein [Lachnospiraceae bacterium]|nr:3-phosphoglycerate dehydrogenase family protein [Lachnospiraceae bacterium]